MFSIYSKVVTNVMNSLSMKQIDAFIEALLFCYKRESSIFIIGNGGSAANASHFCEDLAMGTLSDFENQKRFKVHSLTDNTPAITAWANDTGYENVFKNQVQNLAKPNDLLIAISGSGRSPNIIEAVDWANKQNINTFSLTGFDGGILKLKSLQGIHVPSDNMGIVESVHDIIFHYIVSVLKEEIK